MRKMKGVIAFLGSLAFTLPVVAGNALGKVLTVAVPDGGRPIVARTDKDGAVHLLFDSEDGPRYAKSTDDGMSFSAAIPVVRGGSQIAGLEYNAWDMALGKGGRVHVAMGTNAWKLKLPEEQWGCYYATLDPDASAFSPVRNINKKPSEGFSLAADDRGRVTACWLSGKLYATVSRDNGETFGPNVEINPRFNPCNCCTTSAAYGEDGRLAVFYREETNNERDMYFVLWDQDRNETTRTRVGRTSWKLDGCPMTYYTVTPDRSGFVTAWPTKGMIYFTRLNSRGESSRLPEVETPGRSGMRTGILALSGPDGGTLVAWKKDGVAGWQFYDAEGHPSGPSGTAKSLCNGIAGVVGKDGRFVIFR